MCGYIPTVRLCYHHWDATAPARCVHQWSHTYCMGTDTCIRLPPPDLILTLPLKLIQAQCLWCACGAWNMGALCLAHLLLASVPVNSSVVWPSCESVDSLPLPWIHCYRFKLALVHRLGVSQALHLSVLMLWRYSFCGFQVMVLFSAEGGILVLICGHPCFCRLCILCWACGF